MEVPVSYVNAFTINEDPFTGNGAADDISDDIKQKLATEMNLSETSFVAKAWNKNSKQRENTFTLRWFTPKTEVSLCGHATLATTRVILDQLFSSNKSHPNKFCFETKYNWILNVESDPIKQTIIMDFPLIESTPIDRKTNPWVNQMITNILGLELNESIVSDIEISNELSVKYLLICLKDGEENINKVSPLFDKLLKIETNNSVNLVIVTQKPSVKTDFHFYSRVFCPWLGAYEDPVTGSAHSILAPFWRRKYNEIGIQRQEFIGRQCSKRGGIIGCKIIGQTVQLSGRTRTVVTGVLKL